MYEYIYFASTPTVWRILLIGVVFIHFRPVPGENEGESANMEVRQL
jgi:hypothetical protein